MTEFDGGDERSFNPKLDLVGSEIDSGRFRVKLWYGESGFADSKASIAGIEPFATADLPHVANPPVKLVTAARNFPFVKEPHKYNWEVVDGEKVRWCTADHTSPYVYVIKECGTKSGNVELTRLLYRTISKHRIPLDYYSEDFIDCPAGEDTEYD